MFYPNAKCLQWPGPSLVLYTQDTHCVREEFAKKQGLHHYERCTTMTIGGHLEGSTFPIYRGEIKELEDRVPAFVAVALSWTTSDWLAGLESGPSWRVERKVWKNFCD